MSAHCNVKIAVDGRVSAGSRARAHHVLGASRGGTAKISPHHGPHPSRVVQVLLSRQRGQALLILLVMMSIAVMLLAYGSTTESGRMVKAEARTRAVLEQAKQALIGRAVGDANRPGSLPCPDADDDGSADLFVGSSCPTYLGRLPWRTLGIGDLRDETGERLWYALSVNFRDHPSAPPLNSETRGTLTVYSTSNATVVTSEAIAIVFASGVSLPGQRRDDGMALCSATNKNAPRNRCASNYLDTTSNVSNAAAAGPFIMTPAVQHFNDQLAIIVAADVMPLVESRIALEIRKALLAYRASSKCACYPWADAGADRISDDGINRGRLPAVAARPESWGAGLLPAYIAANDWTRGIYYAVGRTALEGGGKSCVTCVDPNLSVDGAAGYDVVLITPGFAIAAGKRASWTDYLDDPANRDDDDRFVTSLSQEPYRDRLYTIIGAAGVAPR